MRTKRSGLAITKHRPQLCSGLLSSDFSLPGVWYRAAMFRGHVPAMAIYCTGVPVCHCSFYVLWVPLMLWCVRPASWIHVDGGKRARAREKTAKTNIPVNETQFDFLRSSANRRSFNWWVGTVGDHQSVQQNVRIISQQDLFSVI